MKNLNSRDILALAVVIILAIFKLTGHNGTLDVAFAIIIGYYFGRRDDPTLQLPPDMVKSKDHNVELTPKN